MTVLNNYEHGNSLSLGICVGFFRHIFHDANCPFHPGSKYGHIKHKSE